MKNKKLVPTNPSLFYFSTLQNHISYIFFYFGLRLIQSELTVPFMKNTTQIIDSDEIHSLNDLVLGYLGEMLLHHAVKIQDGYLMIIDFTS